MSIQVNLNSLQYMSDVGVPTTDVEWYARYEASPSNRCMADIERARRIADMAFEGLCNTIKPRYALRVV